MESHLKKRQLYLCLKTKDNSLRLQMPETNLSDSLFYQGFFPEEHYEIVSDAVLMWPNKYL